MKTQIDIKSVLCGVAIGVLAVFAIGAGTSSNQFGRYQAVTGTGYALLVDTVTGKVWGRTELWQSTPEFYEPKQQ
jgi:hypothetical protein